MELPTVLYGHHLDVRKQCRKLLAQWLREGGPLLDAFEADGMLAPDSRPGLFLLDGVDSYMGREDHFQCFVPLRLLIERKLDPLEPAMEEAVFTAMLEKPWSLLCMLSSNNMVLWFFREDLDRFRRYTRAMLQHWATLDAEGTRYSIGSNDGAPLWDVALPLVTVLNRLGVPRHLMPYGAPLPEGGLPALVAQADPALAGDLIEFAAAIAAQERATTRLAPAASTPYRYVTAPSAPLVLASEEMAAAMQANDPDTVRRLIEAGESIEAGNMDLLRSPILWAAERGHTELVSFLLERGANVEDRADEGESPLMLAALHGHPQTVRLLLDRGADPYYIPDKGFDVLQFAEMGQNLEVLALLQACWARKDPNFHRVDPDNEVE